MAVDAASLENPHGLRVGTRSKLPSLSENPPSRLGEGKLDSTEWHVQQFADFSEIRAFAQEVRAQFPKLNMDHDVEWVAVAHGWPQNELLILSRRTGGKLMGIAVFRMLNAPLVYGLGGRTLLRLPVRQLKLFQGVTTEHPEDPAAIAACFDGLSKALAQDAVVFIGALPTDSPLYRALNDPRSLLRRRFHVLPWGRQSQHCRIRWQGSFENYLASLGRVTRKDLRRNSRALLTDPNLTCEVRRFRAPEEVDAFLRDGIAISDKTYQKRRLGLGISSGGAVERIIRFAASRGAFLGYILYIDGQPAAFEYAFVCGKTCTMKQAGYDPVWARRHVGSVLFTEVIRDFERLNLSVDCLDLMPDINLFKLRTTNDKQQIQHFYVFPRTLVGTVRFLTLRATDAVSRAIGSLVKRPADPELERYLARADAGWRR